MCSVETCFGKVLARGFCSKHYRKFNKYGDPLGGRTWGTCAQGHDLTLPNARIGRQCRICWSANLRKNNLRRKFKMTEQEWEDLFDAQGRSCAICKIEDEVKWCVDHDHACCPEVHTCGTCVRGILCQSCNARMRALDEWTDEQLEVAQAYKHFRPILSL